MEESYARETHIEKRSSSSYRPGSLEVIFLFNLFSLFDLLFCFNLIEVSELNGAIRL